MDVQQFIDKWWGSPGGQEKSNFAPFIADLCELLELDRPGQSEKGKIGAYEYEASVPGGSLRSLDGTGSIDLYKRGHFIMEAKQSYIKPEQVPLDLDQERPTKAPSGARYDKLMRDARLQAENYAKNLPGTEPVAPFLIVCDIGRAFELYVDTTGNGRGYQFFPDKQSYRIELTELASDAEVGQTGKNALDLLRAIWTDPKSVDPRHISAKVTRDIAGLLADVSRNLEQATWQKRQRQDEDSLKSIIVEEASLFLMRIVFCMFAEDARLLPNKGFEKFLASCLITDEDFDRLDMNRFRNGLEELWRLMDTKGGDRWTWVVDDKVPYFNGSLFQDKTILEIDVNDLSRLINAAKSKWTKVEPAIFGTLLEQALSAEERAKLGAHYTPRAYVETLVRATIMDVLEPEWEAVEEAIDSLLHPSPSGVSGETAPSASSSVRGTERPETGPGVGATGKEIASTDNPTPTPPLKGRGLDEAITPGAKFSRPARVLEHPRPGLRDRELPLCVDGTAAGARSPGDRAD